MSLIARLIEAGTPADLIEEVALLIAEQRALDKRRENERANSARYRARGGDQIPGWMRREVFERDEYTCVDCGSEENLQCDHVIPLAKGGETTLENLQTLCKPCNARKKDKVRKRDKRGQTRTNADRGTVAATSRDNPSLSRPPNEKISNPPTHTHPETLPRARKAVRPEGVSEQVWADFLDHRKAKRASVTETVITQIRNEAAKASWALEDALSEIAARGWQGFKAEWVKDGKANGTGQRQERQGTRAIGEQVAARLAENAH